MIPPEQIAAAASLLRRSLAAGGTVFACGNGGSYADAAHFVGELVGRYKRERPPMRAVLLGANACTVTAIGNDYGYEHIFSRELEALARPGDVLVALTTSGQSMNVLCASSSMIAMGGHVVGMTGRGRAWRVPPPSLVLEADSEDTPAIQEAHHAAAHVLAGLLEES